MKNENGGKIGETLVQGGSVCVKFPNEVEYFGYMAVGKNSEVIDGRIKGDLFHREEIPLPVAKDKKPYPEMAEKYFTQRVSELEVVYKDKPRTKISTKAPDYKANWTKLKADLVDCRDRGHLKNSNQVLSYIELCERQ
jgi:hypothetical protein